MESLISESKKECRDRGKEAAKEGRGRTRWGREGALNATSAGSGKTRNCASAYLLGTSDTRDATANHHKLPGRRGRARCLHDLRLPSSLLATGGRAAGVGTPEAEVKLGGHFRCRRQSLRRSYGCAAAHI